MYCAACDNNNSQSLKSNFNVTATSVSDYQTQCSTFLSSYTGYVNMINKIALYSDTVSSTTATKNALVQLTSMTSTGPNVTLCAKAASKSSTTKDSTSTSSTDKTTTPSASETTVKRRMKYIKRSLQAVQPKPTAPTTESVTVTNDSWTWWKSNSKTAYSWESVSSNDCLGSPGLKAMTDSFVFANTPADFNYFNGIYAALDVLFPVIGNTTSNSKWSGFKGKVVVASYPENSTPVKAPASSTANTTTPSTSKTAAKRLQAVEPTAKATIVIDATAGVDLKKITSTFNSSI